MACADRWRRKQRRRLSHPAWVTAPLHATPPSSSSPWQTCPTSTPCTSTPSPGLSTSSSCPSRTGTFRWQTLVQFVTAIFTSFFTHTQFHCPHCPPISIQFWVVLWCQWQRRESHPKSELCRSISFLSAAHWIFKISWHLNDWGYGFQYIL